MARTILGLDCKMYRGVAGSQAATEMGNVQDVTVECDKEEVSVDTRATAANGWNAVKGGLKNGAVNYKMIYDPTDADFQAIQTAYFANTQLAFFIADDGGGGLDADFEIMKFTVTQPLKTAVTVDVTIKPGRSDRAAQWITGT